MRASIVVVSRALVCVAGLIGAQTPSQNLPRFRAGVDVVEWDVSVYDKDHRPIKSLTAADFTLLEDKLPRPLVAFSEVDIPEPPAPTATWMRDAESDVAANDVKDHSLFLLFIDDASFGEDLMFKQNLDELKQAARTVVNHLGPNDLAAVIFTGDNRRSQEFTGDHRRLLAAIDQTWGPTMPGALANVYAVEVLRRAADYLIGVPGRRKTFIDITRFDVDIGPCTPGPRQPLCIPNHEYLAGQTKLIFESAQRAAINVLMMRLGDHLLLTDGSTTSDPDAVNPGANWSLRLPSETGGQIFLGVRDPKVAEAAVTRIFEANRSYYMLGYTSAAIGKFHFVKVLVDRPGAEVRTREKYYPILHDKPETGPPPPATLASMSGILPTTDIPLRATAAAFASPDGSGATSVAVTINVHHVRAEGAIGPVREALDLRAAVFTAEGDARGSVARAIDVRLPPGRGDMEYEILQRLDIAKPGLYELRLSTHSAARNADGSVYVTVDVPDFAKAPLSLSGIVLTGDNGLAIDGVEALRALVPVTPTTARVFERGEPATAFLRAYQGGGRALQPVVTRTRIVNDHDQPVLDRTETMATARFDRTRAAGILIRLPTGDLPPGQYLLRVEATLGKTSATRELRFGIK